MPGTNQMANQVTAQKTGGTRDGNEHDFTFLGEPVLADLRSLTLPAR
jgi:hypothetical protein